jgi:hypothetical protein
MQRRPPPRPTSFRAHSAPAQAQGGQPGPTRWRSRAPALPCLRPATRGSPRAARRPLQPASFRSPRRRLAPVPHGSAPTPGPRELPTSRRPSIKYTNLVRGIPQLTPFGPRHGNATWFFARGVATEGGSRSKRTGGRACRLFYGCLFCL